PGQNHYQKLRPQEMLQTCRPMDCGEISLRNTWPIHLNLCRRGYSFSPACKISRRYLLYLGLEFFLYRNVSPTCLYCRRIQKEYLSILFVDFGTPPLQFYYSWLLYRLEHQ